MAYIKIYDVYRNGNVIFTGSKAQCCNIFHISKSWFTTLVREHRATKQGITIVFKEKIVNENYSGRRHKNVYGVFTDRGYLIFKGTIDEVAEEFCCSTHHVRHCGYDSNGQKIKFKNEFEVRILGKVLC